MKESLNIEQTQQTVQRLSPRQVQFVRLLEMSGPEIEEEVRRKLDENPALETVDPDHGMEGAGDDGGSEVREDVIDDPDDDPADYMRPAYAADSDSMASRQIAEDSPELNEVLLAQLGEHDVPEIIRGIATYIIGNIDENGYMTRTLAEMRDDIEIHSGVEVSYEQMREAFDLVRSLDPAGVGAVDLRDCLLLQLRRIKPVTLIVKEATAIVADYFDLLSNKHLDRLQAQVGITDRQEMQRALDFIAKLNPKPGSSIAPSKTAESINQITPDVAVELTDDGRYIITLLSNLPQLQIEESFAADQQPVTTHNADLARKQREGQAFIRHRRDEAQAFISALQQRASTLMAVTQAIVSLQPDFFKTGQQALLKPMILKDVAAITGLDLSVISRATAGKYVATNTGTYPLKMFFSEAPKDDSDTSTHQILHALQQVIGSEDKRHPMSDEAIREAMKAKGYDIARRTVTKYREKLGIPVGRLRKSI